MSLSHVSLYSRYRLNFFLMHTQHWPLAEIEGLIPFELDVYVTLLEDHLKRERERLENEARRVH